MEYDYLIVGSGFFGSICAYELNRSGKNVCVIDSRSHIGGNCHTVKKDNIHVHTYGPHVFHTSNEEVWTWINQFVKFNNFTLNVVANYQGEIYPLPFNMWTFNKIWGVSTPEEAKRIIKEQSSNIEEPANLEEQAIKLVGRDVYEKLIKGYTTKQWKKNPRDLPKEIIKRLPVRFVYNNNYFNDKYQGIPIGGYTQIFERLLEGVDVYLETDYFKDKIPDSKKIIYTGAIDRFFNYKYGELEYKSTRFKHVHMDIENYQGCPYINYTDEKVEFTRIIEHKHFEDLGAPSTWVTWEYPEAYRPKVTEPYYPVNDKKNNEMYQKYKIESEAIKNKVLFGGRLAEYKYYDMHKVIESALGFMKAELQGHNV